MVFTIYIYIYIYIHIHTYITLVISINTIIHLYAAIFVRLIQATHAEVQHGGPPACPWRPRSPGRPLVARRRRTPAPPPPAPSQDTLPASVNKNIPLEKTYMRENKLSECQIRGWRAVSAAGLRGQGLHKRASDIGIRYSGPLGRPTSRARVAAEARGCDGAPLGARGDIQTVRAVLPECL